MPASPKSEGRRLSRVSSDQDLVVCNVASTSRNPARHKTTYALDSSLPERHEQRFSRGAAEQNAARRRDRGTFVRSVIQSSQHHHFKASPARSHEPRVLREPQSHGRPSFQAVVTRCRLTRRVGRNHVSSIRSHRGCDSRWRDGKQSYRTSSGPYTAGESGPDNLWTAWRYLCRGNSDCSPVRAAIQVRFAALQGCTRQTALVLVTSVLYSPLDRAAEIDSPWCCRLRPRRRCTPTAITRAPTLIMRTPQQMPRTRTDDCRLSL